MSTTHQLVVTEESMGVRFTCTICGENVLFEFHDIGTPNVTKDENGNWVAPDDIDLYMSDCNP